MSWLNSGPPVEWPSRKHTDTNSDLNFSTSESEDGTVAPTVAIQSDANTGTEPWRQVVQAPEPQNDEPTPRLTRLFVPPPSFKEDNSTSGSETTSSTGPQYQSVNDPPSRRLKVFGRPDTFTNERLGNLLSSMGNVNHTNDTASNQTTVGNRTSANHTAVNHQSVGNHTAVNRQSVGNHTAMNNRSVGNHTTMNNRSTVGNRSAMGNTSAVNESDADLADQLQNEGRKVLQGLAPLHENLAAVQESSLDELEQQLTTRDEHYDDTSKFEPSKFETTSSSMDSGSGNTLDSLPAGLSNWDTMGPVPHHNFNQHLDPNSVHNNLHRASSQTLVGSGGKKRQTDMADLEAEISALGIQEPYAHGEHAHGEHAHNPRPQQFIAPRVRETVSTLDFGAHEFSPQPAPEPSTSSPISTSQRSSSIQSRVSNNHEFRHNDIRHVEEFDRTPEAIVRRNLRFSRPVRRESGVVSGSPKFPQQRGASSTTQSSLSTERPSSQEGVPDRTIATKDVSFSAGFRLLAELIRERVGDDITNLEEVDTIDLSNCELDSVSGLDHFVPHLTTLFLNDNAIRSLDGLPFSLVHLDLSSNRLSFVNTFPQSFVSTLILTNNQLRDLQPLKNLRALSSLDVSDNELKSLSGIENLTALRTLNVNNNKLKSLEINLGMLCELSAANNDISAVHINAPNLESLDLEGNAVAALTDSFPNLRELNLRFNNATVDFRGWQSLETLLFDGNAAMVNVDEIADNLVTFSWERPKGYAGARPLLPRSLLTSVRDLKLGGSSRLGWLFGAHAAVHSAQHLDLANCGIRELPEDFSAQFPFVKSVNLAFNKLTNECIAILQQCANLERLSLFGNRLQVSGEQLARQLPQLRVLDSRSQNRAQNYIQQGEFATLVYTPLEDMSYSAGEHATLVKTHSPELQWLDGKWTENAGTPRPTTRPAFSSALYPLSWNPPAREIAKPIFNDTVETSMIGVLKPWDIVEALCVHHYLHM